MNEWTGLKPISKDDQWKFDTIFKAKALALKCLADPVWLEKQHKRYNRIENNTRVRKK